MTRKTDVKTNEHWVSPGGPGMLSGVAAMDYSPIRILMGIPKDASLEQVLQERIEEACKALPDNIDYDYKIDWSWNIRDRQGGK